MDIRRQNVPMISSRESSRNNPGNCSKALPMTSPVVSPMTFPMTSPTKRAAGFTLIEALIAFVILAGGLMALFRLQSTTMESTADSKIQAQAMALGEAKIEEMRGFLSNDDYQTRMTDGYEQINHAKGVGFAADFMRTWRVDTSVDPAKITVLVGWTNRRGDTQSVSMTSYVRGGDPDADGRELAATLAGVDSDPSGGFGGTSDENGSGGGSPGDVTVILRDAEGAELPAGTVEGDSIASYDVWFSGAFTEVSPATLDAVGLKKTSGTGSEGECAIDTATGIFTCFITGISNNDRWEGVVTFITKGGTDSVVCLVPGNTATLSIDQHTTSLTAASTPNISSIKVADKAVSGCG